MNKSEVNEIRRQMEPERCTIERICTCYVGNDKEKKFMSRDSFLLLPDEERFKYLAFFKRVLTGTLGKNLLNLEFPISEEMKGGKQEFLYSLRESELEDDDLLEKFYDRIIENYVCPDKYCIILVYAAYDIPGKGSDKLDMEDASDYVYRYMICSICPIELSKGALGYDIEKNRIGELKRDLVVKDPDKGFLFPAFSDRTTDIHEMLYYMKKPEDMQPEFVEAVFGAEPPLTPKGQIESFNAILSDCLGEEGDVEVMKNIHENLNELVEENRDNPEPLSIGKPEIKRLLNRSGIPNEKLEGFDERFEEIAGDNTELMVTNLPGIKKFNISTPDIEIHVKPEYVDRLEARVIDGRECIVIVVDDHIDVNGVNVRTLVKD